MGAKKYLKLKKIRSSGIWNQFLMASYYLSKLEQTSLSISPDISYLSLVFIFFIALFYFFKVV